MKPFPLEREVPQLESTFCHHNEMSKVVNLVGGTGCFN